MNDFRPSLLDQPKLSRDFPRRASRRWLWTTAVTAVVALGAAAAYVAAPGWFDLAAAAPPPPPPAAVAVSVAVVEQRDTAIWTEFSGRLEAVSRVEIRPRAGGAIMGAHFREGSLVKQGDLLFTIDPAPYAADVRRLEAMVVSANARLVLAGKQQRRGLQLGAANDLPGSEVDQRVNEFAAADANLRAAAASLETARLNLGYTEVRAPFSGRVGKIEATPGNLVAAGPSAPVLTTLVSVDPIYASFEADEQSAARALATLPPTTDLTDAIGRIPVEMGTLATDGTPLRGRLQLVDNVVAAASGTLRVRAVFDNPDGHLIPGQFARLRLGEARTQPVIGIEERAIGTDQDRRFVLVVDEANKVATREVSLGAMADGLRIVTKGLHPGERIVVDGLQRVRPGSVVAPKSVAALAAR